MEKLKNLINSYKDFPKKGIEFKDLLGILQDPEVFKELINKMSERKIIKNCDAIVSIDARGFIFGSAISLYSSKPMLVARKPGKLPGEIEEEKYDLEYGVDSLSIQKNALNKYINFAIVDDLLATGGTAECLAKLLEKNNKKVVGLITVVELVELKGRNKFHYPVESMLCI